MKWVAALIWTALFVAHITCCIVKIPPSWVEVLLPTGYITLICWIDAIIN